MRIGSLDRRIQLQSKAVSSDGDPTSGTWTTQVTVAAERLNPRGIERFLGARFAAEGSQAFRIRYRTDVTPSWRVLDGDTSIWWITAVHEGAARRRETLLEVSRLNPADA
jgi:head-tail adaptor